MIQPTAHRRRALRHDQHLDMIHFTAFGASEADITPAGFTALTLFGAAEFKRPTLAKRIMQRRRESERTPARWERILGRDRGIVITLFGGCEIVAPTVLEEYAALRSLMTSGAISKDDCLRLIQEVAGRDDTEMEVSRITLFGVCAHGVPDTEKENHALDAAARAGTISSETRRELAGAIGCPESALADVVAHVALA